jgi:hypothetical protein
MANLRENSMRTNLREAAGPVMALFAVLAICWAGFVIWLISLVARALMKYIGS